MYLYDRNKQQQQTRKATPASIRVLKLNQKGRTYWYAQLVWNKSKSTKSLGYYPHDSPTALLDVSVMAAWHGDLTEEELRCLLAANKSMRD
jgi:hypothetical protein